MSEEILKRRIENVVSQINRELGGSKGTNEVYDALMSPATEDRGTYGLKLVRSFLRALTESDPRKQRVVVTRGLFLLPGRQVVFDMSSPEQVETIEGETK